MRTRSAARSAELAHDAQRTLGLHSLPDELLTRMQTALGKSSTTAGCKWEYKLHSF